MSGFMNNWGQPPMQASTSAPPFFSPDAYGGFGGMSAWGQPAGGGLATAMTGTDFSSLPGSSISSMLSAPDNRLNSSMLTGAKAGGQSGFGFNAPTAQLAMTGLGTIGNLWAAFKAQKLAGEQFKYTKGVTETNLQNQLKTYNSALTDRANNRAIVEGRTPDQTKAYIDANSLSRYGK